MRGVAFKVTYNDGGARKGGLIGYRGVCSNPVILDNVKIRSMTNCADSNCPCRHFADANFSGRRPDLKSHSKWCYESTLLSQKPWRFGAGIYHHGARTGQLIPMKQASVGDIAFLSTIRPGADEIDRFIFAMFRIGEVSEDAKWGIVVTSDGSLDILIPDGIAPLLKFWNYYKNSSGTVKWGTGLFRYLDDNLTESILADSMGALGDSDDSQLIYKALESKVLPQHRATSRAYGGEGAAHKSLKLRVAKNPTLIGLPANAKAHIEHPFVSGDRVDIKFDLPDGTFAVVEIETTIPLPGAYQCIKYRALLEAEQQMPINSNQVKPILVAYSFDSATKDLARKYGITTCALPPC